MATPTAVEATYQPRDQNAMLAAALDLAAQGWAVFPCLWCGGRAKSPLTEHGHHDATRDPGVIRAWWARWPQAMIGAPVPESLTVLDIDPRNGGELAALTALTGPLPPTLTVWSGRGDGGIHLYFRRPAGPVTSTGLPVGVDLKATGYMIMPPSIHPVTGHAYAWVHRPAAPMPPALRDLLRPHPFTRGPRVGAPRRGLAEFVAEQTEGNRNAGLFWAACRAVEAGTLDQVADELTTAALRVGLSETEARRTIESARRTEVPR